MDVKNIYNGLNSHQHELPILAELAGIKADPAVFRILIELLALQIEPEALHKLLRYIRRSKNPPRPGQDPPRVKKEH